MLRRIRTDKITEKVTECAGNTKKLYSLVSYLTGLEIENPMLPGKTDGKLAEEFAEYFMQKIKTILRGSGISPIIYTQVHRHARA